MNRLVKILTDDSGIERRVELQYWHLVDPTNAIGDATLCEGEFFGVGESGCDYQTKQVQRGGITCPECLSKIKTIKAVKL